MGQHNECKIEQNVMGTPSYDQNVEDTKLDSIMMQIGKINLRMDQMQQKIDDMDLRINNEQKIGALMNEFESMKQIINQLMLNNNNGNTEKEKMRLWLENDVKLPEYYDVLINNGIDELSVIKLITKDTLKDIGIYKIGHQMKILNQVNQLK